MDPSANTPTMTSLPFETPTKSPTKVVYGSETTPEKNSFPAMMSTPGKAGSTRNSEQEMQVLYHASPTKSTSISQCRYCYTDIRRTASASTCHCSGSLCQRCLVREVVLTYNRAQDVACTVCKKPYAVTAQQRWNCGKDCSKFMTRHMRCLGLKDDEFLLDSIGGKIGYTLVILGITVWIVSTGMLFVMPSHGLPHSLFYVISAFDVFVGTSTLWFVVKCRWLITLFLSLLYLTRSLQLMLGCIPKINLMNIGVLQKNNINVISYFISFSFIAFVILTVCWIMDIAQQMNDYKMQNQTLVVDGVELDMTEQNEEEERIEIR